MDYERQLKLQSFLDGELSEGEKREVANWLAQDKEATALLGELRNTRSAMVGFEIGLELPESREFFWSKVSRQIEALEPEPAVSSSPSWLRFLRRVLVPTAAIAALVLAAFLVTTQSPPRYSGAETALDDSGAFTYHDYDE
ncbi:MAG: hypothetical protein C5B50_30485, partial [Verrucomicrobia bacterium]